MFTSLVKKNQPVPKEDEISNWVLAGDFWTFSLPLQDFSQKYRDKGYDRRFSAKKLCFICPTINSNEVQPLKTDGDTLKYKGLLLYSQMLLWTPL